VGGAGDPAAETIRVCDRDRAFNNRRIADVGGVRVKPVIRHSVAGAHETPARVAVCEPENGTDLQPLARGASTLAESPWRVRCGCVPTARHIAPTQDTSSSAEVLAVGGAR
jgi:hypothetical protein